MAQFDQANAVSGNYYIGNIRKNAGAVNGQNRGICGNVGANQINGGTIGFIVDAVATDYFDFTFQVASTSTFDFWLRFSAQYLGA